MTSYRSIKRSHMTAAAFACVAIAISMPARSQQANSAYIKNAEDPVQAYISQALLGFAFQKKCAVVAPTEEAMYERALNQATITFQAYALAKGLITQPEEAVQYSRNMAMGAIRFAAANSCDERARKRVESGHRVATEFQALIKPYLDQPSSK